MLLSIPTGRDLRGFGEKRAHVANVMKRFAAFRFMRASGIEILGK